MTAASTSRLVAAAAATGDAVFAFNVITLEHAEAIVAGLEAAGSAGIMQFSERAIQFHAGRLSPLLAACIRLAQDAATPIALHLDHFEDFDLTVRAIDEAEQLGISSIMLDRSRLEYAENVAQTKQFAERAHGRGLWVEAELGEVGGKDGAHAVGARTDPAEARAFVAATEVDGLAVAVGSSHAKTTTDTQLDLALIARLADAVPVPLVLHGSSGVADGMLIAAVGAGIRKLNVGTALNIQFTGEVRRYLAKYPEAVDPRGYLSEGRIAMSRKVAALCALMQGRTP